MYVLNKTAKGTMDVLKFYAIEKDGCFMFYLINLVYLFCNKSTYNVIWNAVKVDVEMLTSSCLSDFLFYFVDSMISSGPIIGSSMCKHIHTDSLKLSVGRTNICTVNVVSEFRKLISIHIRINVRLFCYCYHNYTVHIKWSYAIGRLLVNYSLYSWIW